MISAFARPGMVRMKRELHLHKEAGGKPVHIDFLGMSSFGLEEDLVMLLLGELDHLILDRRAIARAVPSICPRKAAT